MNSAAGLAMAASGALAGLKVMALVEATRLTGIARNVLDYARASATGAGGVDVAMALALIRRGGESAWRIDPLRELAAAAAVPVELLFERHRYDQQIVERLRHLVHARRPHIIETHHVKSHCLVALSGLWRHYTWVAFHHGYTQTDVRVRAYNHVDRWSLRHAAHVVTTSESFSKMLAARGVAASRITVLHNGVRETPVAESAVAEARHVAGALGWGARGAGDRPAVARERARAPDSRRGGVAQRRAADHRRRGSGTPDARAAGAEPWRRRARGPGRPDNARGAASMRSLTCSCSRH